MSNNSRMDMSIMTKQGVYKLGDIGEPHDMELSESENENILRTSLLCMGDCAFVLRSDKTWSFGMVTEIELDDIPHITFIVDNKGSTKSLHVKRWASGIKFLQGHFNSNTNAFIHHLGLCLENAKSSRYLNGMISSLSSKVKSLQIEGTLDADMLGYKLSNTIDEGGDGGASRDGNGAQPLLEKRVPSRDRIFSSDILSDSSTTIPPSIDDLEYDVKSNPSKVGSKEETGTIVQSGFFASQRVSPIQGRETSAKTTKTKVTNGKAALSFSKTKFRSLFEETMQRVQ